jgi:hypothetical protein
MIPFHSDLMIYIPKSNDTDSVSFVYFCFPASNAYPCFPSQVDAFKQIKWITPAEEG